MDNFSAALRPGTGVLCLLSTMVPKRIGMRGTVVRRTRYHVRLNMDGDVPYNMYLPSRKMDLIEETATRIRYRTARGDMVSWEIVSQPEKTS